MMNLTIATIAYFMTIGFIVVMMAWLAVETIFDWVMDFYKRRIGLTRERRSELVIGEDGKLGMKTTVTYNYKRSEFNDKFVDFYIEHYRY